MAHRYKIIFAGTPDFALATLQALIDSPHEVVAVYTQPDRPAGRGQKLSPSPVKQLATKYQLPIHQPQTLTHSEEQQLLRAYQADLMVVVAYGLLLPKAILTAPRLGCINVHASILPRWRGAAPIQRAILAGDCMTGISIMQMDEGLDTGAIWRITECAIASTDTSQSLHDKLSHIGAESLLATLEDIQQGASQPVPQPSTGSIYATKITKAEAAINWEQSALTLYRQILAFTPWPICFSRLDTETIRIWQAEPIELQHQGIPGEILQVGSDGVVVATGKGALKLLRLQLPGGKPLACQDLRNARPTLLTPGKQFT